MEQTHLPASRIVRFLFVHCSIFHQEPTQTHCSSAWWKTYSSRARKVFTCLMP